MTSDDINENEAVFVTNQLLILLVLIQQIVMFRTNPTLMDGSKKQATTCQVSCCKTISNTITTTFKNGFARFVYYERFLKFVISIL